MKLDNTYLGVTLTFRYDHVTNTFFGNLDGLPVSASVQATTYEDLIEAFRETVDTYSTDLFLMARLQAQHDREAKPRAMAGMDSSGDPGDADPYSRRQFLR